MAELTGDEPDLKSGDTGAGVVMLQARLFALGMHPEVPDGSYGMATENAVRNLQSSRGLDNNGDVTRDTWEAVVYYEQQAAIQYQYPDPYYALGQINYDLEHPADGGPYCAVIRSYGLYPQGAHDQQGQGQYGQGQYGQDQYAQFAGQLSEDGSWRWDGYAWQAAEGGSGDTYASTAGEVGHSSEYVGQLSPDGNWRWDGSDWHPADGGGHGHSDDYVGQLSPDGNWRWDGSDWHAA